MTGYIGAEEGAPRLRKTDRRTLYTVQAVKDALLSLIGQMPYEKVNVAKVCREAQITRTTFYAHFEGLTDVLNQVIDDALLFSQQAGADAGDAAGASDLVAIVQASVEDIKRHETMLPACQRIADSAKYRSLFLDPTLADYIVGRIYRRVRGQMVPEISAKTGVPADEAELLLQFVLHGSFSVNQRLGWNKTDDWYRFQRTLNIFAAGGYDALARAQGGAKGSLR